MGTPVPQNFAVSSITAGTTGGITIAKPSGTVDGDFLLAFIAVGNETVNSITFTDPSGWTLLGNIYANNQYFRCYSKIASSEPSSWTWTPTNTGSTQYKMGACVNFKDYSVAMNIDGITVQSVTTGVGAGGRAVNFAGSVSPTITNDLIIICTFNQMQSGGTTDSTAYTIATNNPGSWTEMFDSGGVAQASNAINIALAYATRPATGTTGNYATTLTPSPNASTGSTSAGFLIALTRNIISTVAVTDVIVTVEPKVSFTALFQFIVKDIVATVDTMSTTISTLWVNLQKSATNIWKNLNKS